MSLLNFTNEIIVSFIGTLFALFSAGIVWILKSAYEKHRAEVFALSKFETIFANNLTILKDNFNFLNDWINSLENNRAFSIHFEGYYINEEETYKIKNLELINRLLSLNYMLRRTGFDFENTYKTYWEGVRSVNEIKDEESRERNFEALNKNLLPVLQKMNSGYKVIEDKLVDVVAYIRCANNVRKHSIFGYFSVLFLDIYPKITDNSVKRQVEILRENISRLD